MIYNLDSIGPPYMQDYHLHVAEIGHQVNADGFAWIRSDSARLSLSRCFILVVRLISKHYITNVRRRPRPLIPSPNQLPKWQPQPPRETLPSAPNTSAPSFDPRSCWSIDTPSLQTRLQLRSPSSLSNRQLSRISFSCKRNVGSML